MIGLLFAVLAGVSGTDGFSQVAIVDPAKGLSFSEPDALTHWYYPDDALEQNKGGTVKVRLGLGADGSISRCDVIASSGSEALDRGSCQHFQSHRVIGSPGSQQLPFAIDARVAWTVPPPDHPSRARIDASIFREEDYPKDAIEDEAEGITGVELRLGDSGNVRSCSVMASSGHASLDAKTCQVFIERGRASMKGSGAKVAATTKARVSWVLPQGVYFGDFLEEVRVRTDTNGQAPSCAEVSLDESTPIDPVQCNAMVMLLSAMHRSAGVGQGEASFGEGMIAGNDLANAENKMVGTILMRGAARFSVASDGKVMSCEEVKAEEWKRAAPDIVEAPATCPMVEGTRFERLGERQPGSSAKDAPSAAPFRRGIYYQFVTHAASITDG